jgi:hypothetical protein
MKPKETSPADLIRAAGFSLDVRRGTGPSNWRIYLVRNGERVASRLVVRSSRDTREAMLQRLAEGRTHCGSSVDAAVEALADLAVALYASSFCHAIGTGEA